MIERHDISLENRIGMLTAIRSDAREVETALSDLADIDLTALAATGVEGVVLLDQEARSIASTTITDATFESDLAPSRAGGDSAKVRQVLRTVLHAAADSGADLITVRSSERGIVPPLQFRHAAIFSVRKRPRL